MAHPYDDNGFRHYLKFYDFNMDWYEICEPIGFDGAKYVKKQLSNRWTRDVEYFAIDGLTFPDVFGEKLSTPRVYNPQGDLSEYMDYGLWYLLENRRLKGSEMKVGYKVSRNGVDFKEFALWMYGILYSVELSIMGCIIILPSLGFFVVGIVCYVLLKEKIGYLKSL